MSSTDPPRAPTCPHCGAKVQVTSTNEQLSTVYYKCDQCRARGVYCVPKGTRVLP